MNEIEYRDDVILLDGYGIGNLTTRGGWADAKEQS